MGGSLSAIYGWYTNQWRKSGLPLNISDSLDHKITETNASVGNNTLTGTTVPTGEIWVVKTVWAQNVNTNPALVFLRIQTGTNTHNINRTATPGANVPVIQNGEYVLFPGWSLDTFVTGCAAGDDLILAYIGYIIDVLD